MRHLGPLDITQMIWTSGLFLANLIISWLVHRNEFTRRLKYLGQEMTFLALGLIVARISLAETNDKLPPVVICLILFLLAWLGMMALSEAIVEHGKLWRNPLVYLTMLLGALFVYLALTGLPIGIVQRALSLVEPRP